MARGFADDVILVLAFLVLCKKMFTVASWCLLTIHVPFLTSCMLWAGCQSRVCFSFVRGISVSVLSILIGKQKERRRARPDNHPQNIYNRCPNSNRCYPHCHELVSFNYGVITASWVQVAIGGVLSRVSNKVCSVASACHKKIHAMARLQSEIVVFGQ